MSIVLYKNAAKEEKRKDAQGGEKRNRSVCRNKFQISMCALAGEGVHHFIVR